MRNKSFLTDVSRFLDRIPIYCFPILPFSIAGFFGRSYWLFDLCSHFRVQYLVASLLVMALCILRKRTSIAILAGALAVVNAASIFNLDKHESSGLEAGDATRRVILFNVNSANARLPDVRQFIEKEAPDFVALLEISENICNALNLKALGYKYQIQHPRIDNFGIGLYSKAPLIEPRIVVFGEDSLPSIVTDIEFDGVRLTIIVTHPLPPVSEKNSLARNIQLNAIADHIPKLNPRARIVMMDMNASPWSFIFKEFLIKTNLQDSRRSFGIQATWPTSLFPLRIPIDHIFVSPDIRVISRKIGPDLGSDHYPVILDFVAHGK